MRQEGSMFPLAATVCAAFEQKHKQKKNFQDTNDANESLVLGTLCDLNCKGPKPQHAPWTQLIHKTSNGEKARYAKEDVLLASCLSLISDLSVVKTPASHVTVVIQDEITNQVRILTVRPLITLKFNPSCYGYGFLTPAGRIDLLFEPEAENSDPRTYDHSQSTRNLSCKVTTDSCNETCS